MESAPAPNNNHKLQLNLDLRYVIVALLLIIAVMLVAWRPWQTGSTVNARTITVTGQANLKAEPDEYDFSPSYTFTNPDKTNAVNQSSAKSQVLTAALKKLGVIDSKIKTSIDGYSNYDGSNSADSTGYTYTLNLTVSVDNKTLAQKVQDYLATTAPEGSVTPSATFSNAKRQQLNSAARDQAVKDARTKADQSATNLGFKVDKVKSLQDDNGQNFGGPLMAQAIAGANSTSGIDTRSGVSLQPGQSDLTYSVTVVYYIK